MYHTNHSTLGKSTGECLQDSTQLCVLESLTTQKCLSTMKLFALCPESQNASFPIQGPRHLTRARCGWLAYKKRNCPEPSTASLLLQGPEVWAQAAGGSICGNAHEKEPAHDGAFPQGQQSLLARQAFHLSIPSGMRKVRPVIPYGH